MTKDQAEDIFKNASLQKPGEEITYLESYAFGLGINSRREMILSIAVGSVVVFRVICEIPIRLVLDADKVALTAYRDKMRWEFVISIVAAGVRKLTFTEEKTLDSIKPKEDDREPKRISKPIVMPNQIIPFRF